MFPDNELSAETPDTYFLSYLQGKQVQNIDVAQGGFALNDPSQGLDFQLWKGRLYKDGSVTVASEASNFVTEINVGTLPLKSRRISIAFDTNMRVVFAAINQVTGKIYWYDATSLGHVFTDIPNCRDIFVRNDDNRPEFNNIRDSIVSYITLDNRLCFRLSRDRFEIEYFLKDVHKWQRMYQVGMNVENRFQWELVFDDALIKGC